MIIYIIIGIIVMIVMIAIIAYIYNGKSNKKFTFQNKHYKQLHQNPTKLLSQKIISNEQENKYNRFQYLLNEQENKYNRFQYLLNEQEKQYIQFQFNEQEEQYTPPKVPLAQPQPQLQQQPSQPPPPQPQPPPPQPQQQPSQPPPPQPQQQPSQPSQPPPPQPPPPQPPPPQPQPSQPPPPQPQPSQPPPPPPEIPEIPIAPVVPISEKEQINESEKVKKCPYITPYYISPYNNTAMYQNPSPYGLSCWTLSQWPEEYQQEYSLNYPPSIRVPYAKPGEVAWDECNKRCTKFVCSAESENKPECPIITTETCNAYNNNYEGHICSELSNLTVESQETPAFDGTSLVCMGLTGSAIPTVEKGQICWDSCNEKCVSPERPKEQSHLKSSFNPLCKPTMATCDTTQLIGNNWNQTVYEPSAPGGRRTVFSTGLQRETCEEWSNFTNWQEHGLTPIVLPGEICFNPCTGNCTAPKTT